jgi:hypothetical protein
MMRCFSPIGNGWKKSDVDKRTKVIGAYKGKKIAYKIQMLDDM